MPRFYKPGTFLRIRLADGSIGYFDKLRHGVTGKGLNDFDSIFRILAENNYRGWVSIEDGMNGMEEMAESLAFLRRVTAKYCSASDVFIGWEKRRKATL